MIDDDKTNELLIKELAELRQRITELEAAEADHKLIEDNFRDSEARYRGLYESSIDGICHSTLEGNLVDCNQALADMLGYTQEELYKLSAFELIPSKWHNMMTKISKTQTIPQGYSDEYEIEFVRKDGTIFPASVRTQPRPTSSGSTFFNASPTLAPEPASLTSSSCI